jgi:glycosyltransferase involved in cell wall biosynthesis
VTSLNPLKVLIFVVAYNAGKAITQVLERIPQKLSKDYDISLLVIDDSSQDDTKIKASNFLKNKFWCPFTILRNPRNLGYGGNQKLGYQFAIDNNFDVVVLLHGDGQYAPEAIQSLLTPFQKNNSPDAVFGSRMINRKDALKGGMPFYKFLGNQVLTKIQNTILRSNLSEFHSGFRVYSVNALRIIPFDLNTDDFHFDTEIIVQLFTHRMNVLEIPISTFYGDEICHVNGIKYAWDVLKVSIKARFIKMGILYDPKFVPNPNIESNYVSKFEFLSTHSVAFSQIKNNSIVLDLGCADGYLSKRLFLEKKCKVFSVDIDKNKDIQGCHYQGCNLNDSLPKVPWKKLNTIILLDVIEHIHEPELFLKRLRKQLNGNANVEIIISSGNVCFFITRIMMALGQFNYGQRGILDMTHTRLFTINSLSRLLRYEGYEILKKEPIPGPYPLALGLNYFSKLLIKVNQCLNYILPGLFAYQMLYVVKPKPDTKWLINELTRNKTT